MNVFVVDLTHGGVKIATELAKSKNYEKIIAYDLYNTIKKDDENLLKTYNINIINNLNEFKKCLKINFIKKTDHNKDLIINPIHSCLNIEKLLKEIDNELNNRQNNENSKINEKEKNSILNSYKIINHHEATKLILKPWMNKTKDNDIKTIEVTGVKGKTSVVFLLKEIMIENNMNTLILSSLGAHLFKINENKEYKDVILQKNISITPANVINTIQLAKKIANPKCSVIPTCVNDKNKDKIMEILKSNGKESLEDENKKEDYKFNHSMNIFENSLGVCGIGDIGILTNIIENYPIAKNSSDAKEAKKQIFKCPNVVIEEETLNKYYKYESKIYLDKINTFSLENKTANVFCENIKYDIDKTIIDVKYQNVKRIDKSSINGKLKMEVFAPGPHHVLNVLASITSSLVLGISEEIIKTGLSKFKGIAGRTHNRKINNLRIIEEINPGINTKAIESSINMIQNINDYYIIIGGKYGVTCEEIDENKLSKFLNQYINKNPNTNLILTDELGNSIKNRLNELNNANNNKTSKFNNETINKSQNRNYNIKYEKDYKKAIDKALNNNKNILFIYRSNYSQISKR